jgi:hypothetical protein
MNIHGTFVIYILINIPAVPILGYSLHFTGFCRGFPELFLVYPAYSYTKEGWIYRIYQTSILF